MIGNQKYCPRCSFTKAESFFSVSKTNPSGLADICQSCEDAINSMIKLIGDSQRKTKEA